MGLVLTGLLNIPEMSLENLNFTYELFENDRLGSVKIINIQEEIYNKLSAKGIVTKAFASTSKGEMTFFELMFFNSNNPDKSYINLHVSRYTQGAFLLDSNIDGKLRAIRFEIKDIEKWVDSKITIEEKDNKRILQMEEYRETRVVGGFEISVDFWLSAENAEMGSKVIATSEHFITIKKLDSNLEELTSLMYEFIDFMSILTHCDIELGSIILSAFIGKKLEFARYSGDFRNLYREKQNSREITNENTPVDFSTIRGNLLEKFEAFHSALSTKRKFIYGLSGNLRYDPYNEASFFKIISNIENYLDGLTDIEKEVIPSERFKLIAESIKKDIQKFSFEDEAEKTKVNNLLANILFLNSTSLRAKLKKMIEKNKTLHLPYLVDIPKFITNFLEKRNALAHSRKSTLSIEDEQILYGQIKIMQLVLFLVETGFSEIQIIKCVQRIKSNAIVGFDFGLD